MVPSVYDLAGAVYTGNQGLEQRTKLQDNIRHEADTDNVAILRRIARTYKVSLSLRVLGPVRVLIERASAF